MSPIQGAKVEITGGPAQMECRINGVPLPELVEFTFNSGTPDEIPKLEARLQALGPLSLVVDNALVNIQITVISGFKLKKLEQGHITIYTTEPDFS